MTDKQLQENAINTDVAIITIGRKSGEAADRTQDEFNLYNKELKMIRQVSETYHKEGKKVIVLLNICSPIETSSWKSLVDGILCTWQSGEQIGNSIADVVSGAVNPSGKLPITFQNAYGDAASDKNFPSDVKDMKDLATMYMWGEANQNNKREPKANIDYTNYDEDIYVGYRYFDSFNKEVSFPFGFGLSYTTFAYNKAKVIQRGNVYNISIEVKNTGKYAGRNVVELFVAAPKSKSLNKPIKELRDYAKTRLLQPGESETMTMNINTDDLASFNEKASAWKTDAGTYQFLICSSAQDVEARCLATVKSSVRKVNNVMKPLVKLHLLHR